MPKTPTTFKQGDVCYLVCGSQRMAVEQVEADKVHCVWMHYETKTVLRDAFAPALLSKAS